MDSYNDIDDFDDNAEIDYAEDQIEGDADDNHHSGYTPEQLPFEDSYKQRERANFYAHQEWNELETAPMTGEYPIGLTPEQIFKYDLMNIFYSKQFTLDDKDKTELVGRLETMHWKLFKMPMMYIAGYLFFKEKSKKKALENIEISMRSDWNKKYTRDIIKYGRYWKNILA